MSKLGVGALGVGLGQDSLLRVMFDHWSFVWKSFLSMLLTIVGVLRTSLKVETSYS